VLRPPEIERLFQSPLFRRAYAECDHPDAWAALPDPALEFLVALGRQLGITTVFEFGSGRSTVALLRASYLVTSLENTDYWMSQTLSQLSAEEKARHTALVRPLRFHWHHLIPVLDWTIDSELGQRMWSADFVLIDAPFYSAFRERTLCSALIHSPHAVIALDDTRVPTLSRFCDRIAADNPTLLHARVRVGHGLDVFARSGDTPLRLRPPPLEILKGWRRYFLARRYAPSLFTGNHG
jgi:hypothetical protein